MESPNNLQAYDAKPISSVFLQEKSPKKPQANDKYVISYNFQKSTNHNFTHNILIGMNFNSRPNQPKSSTHYSTNNNKISGHSLLANSKFAQKANAQTIKNTYMSGAKISRYPNISSKGPKASMQIRPVFQNRMQVQKQNQDQVVIQRIDELGMKQNPYQRQIRSSQLFQKRHANSQINMIPFSHVSRNQFTTPKKQKYQILPLTVAPSSHIAANKHQNKSIQKRKWSNNNKKRDSGLVIKQRNKKQQNNSQQDNQIQSQVSSNLEIQKEGLFIDTFQPSQNADFKSSKMENSNKSRVQKKQLIEKFDSAANIAPGNMTRISSKKLIQDQQLRDIELSLRKNEPESFKKGHFKAYNNRNTQVIPFQVKDEKIFNNKQQVKLFQKPNLAKYNDNKANKNRLKNTSHSKQPRIRQRINKKTDKNGDQSQIGKTKNQVSSEIQKKNTLITNQSSKKIQRGTQLVNRQSQVVPRSRFSKNVENNQNTNKEPKIKNNVKPNKVIQQSEEETQMNDPLNHFKTKQLSKQHQNYQKYEKQYKKESPSQRSQKISIKKQVSPKTSNSKRQSKLHKKDRLKEQDKSNKEKASTVDENADHTIKGIKVQDIRTLQRTSMTNRSTKDHQSPSNIDKIRKSTGDEHQNILQEAEFAGSPLNPRSSLQKRKSMNSSNSLVNRKSLSNYKNQKLVPTVPRQSKMRQRKFKNWKQDEGQKLQKEHKQHKQLQQKQKKSKLQATKRNSNPSKQGKHSKRSNSPNVIDLDAQQQDKFGLNSVKKPLKAKRKQSISALKISKQKKNDSKKVDSKKVDSSIEEKSQQQSNLTSEQKNQENDQMLIVDQKLNQGFKQQKADQQSLVSDEQAKLMAENNKQLSRISFINKDPQQMHKNSFSSVHNQLQNPLMNDRLGCQFQKQQLLELENQAKKQQTLMEEKLRKSFLKDKSKNQKEKQADQDIMKGQVSEFKKSELLQNKDLVLISQTINHSMNVTKYETIDRDYNNYKRAPILNFIDQKTIQKYYLSSQKSKLKVSNFINYKIIQNPSASSLDGPSQAVQILLSIDPWIIQRIIEPYLDSEGHNGAWLYCHGRWHLFKQPSTTDFREFLIKCVNMAIQQLNIQSTLESALRLLSGVRIMTIKGNKKGVLDELQYSLKKGHVMKVVTREGSCWGKRMFELTKIQKSKQGQKILQLKTSQDVYWVKQDKFNDVFDYFLFIGTRKSHFWITKTIQSREDHIAVLRIKSQVPAQGSLTVFYPLNRPASLFLYKELDSKVLKLMGKIKQKANFNSNIYFEFKLHGSYVLFLQTPANCDLGIQSTVRVDAFATEYISSESLRNDQCEYMQLDKVKNIQGKDDEDTLIKLKERFLNMVSRR